MHAAPQLIAEQRRRFRRPAQYRRRCTHYHKEHGMQLQDSRGCMPCCMWHALRAVPRRRRTLPDEALAVLVDVGKVLLRLALVGRAQPLVVLDGPPRGRCLLPGLVLRHREEAQALPALGRLQQRQPWRACMRLWTVMLCLGGKQCASFWSLAGRRQGAMPDMVQLHAEV